MKKQSTVIGILLVMMMGVSMYMLKDNVMLNRINPFIETAVYYTVVDNDGKHVGEDKIRKGKDSYMYEFIGYDEDGEKQPITIKVTKHLRKDAYLKIIAKGTNGKSWMEVKREDIPVNVEKKLSSK